MCFPLYASSCRTQKIVNFDVMCPGFADITDCGLLPPITTTFARTPNGVELVHSARPGYWRSMWAYPNVLYEASSHGDSRSYIRELDAYLSHPQSQACVPRSFCSHQLQCPICLRRKGVPSPLFLLGMPGFPYSCGLEYRLGMILGREEGSHALAVPRRTLVVWAAHTAHEKQSLCC